MTNQEKIQELARLIESQQRERFIKQYGQRSDYDNVTPACCVDVIPGRRYTKIDIGSSGRYMVDENGDIWGIKAYGVINRVRHYGNLETFQDYWWGECTAIPKSHVPRVVTHQHYIGPQGLGVLRLLKTN